MAAGRPRLDTAVRRVVLDTGVDRGDYPRAYTLETSTDGSTWTHAGHGRRQRAADDDRLLADKRALRTRHADGLVGKLVVGGGSARVRLTAAAPRRARAEGPRSAVGPAPTASPRGTPRSAPPRPPRGSRRRRAPRPPGAAGPSPEDHGANRGERRRGAREPPLRALAGRAWRAAPSRRSISCAARQLGRRRRAARGAAPARLRARRDDVAAAPALAAAPPANTKGSSRRASCHTGTAVFAISAPV